MGGMVERFNGRIEEVLQSHQFRSGEALEATLLRYVQQLPQSVLGCKTPPASDEEMVHSQVEAVRGTAILPYEI